MEQAIIALAASITIGVTAFAAAMVQRAIGAAGVGAMAEKPELAGTIIILVAIPETLVILGFAIAAIILLGG